MTPGHVIVFRKGGGEWKHRRRGTGRQGLRSSGCDRKVVSPSAGRGLEVPSPNEMAEAAVLAWVRGPGTAWKALPCASVGCSVRDVIYRHCEEQVRIAVPGSGGGKITRPSWVRRGCFCSLNISVFETEISPVSGLIWDLPLLFYGCSCFVSML